MGFDGPAKLWKSYLPRLCSRVSESGFRPPLRASDPNAANFVQVMKSDIPNLQVHLRPRWDPTPVELRFKALSGPVWPVR